MAGFDSTSVAKGCKGSASDDDDGEFVEENDTSTQCNDDAVRR
jgi:hypothetical protein